jgi:hypothetical protein
MRRSTNVMLTTLAVVCLVTVVAVAVALVRYEGEGQHDEHGTKPGDSQTTLDSTQHHGSAVGRQPTPVKPDSHDLAHDR